MIEAISMALLGERIHEVWAKLDESQQLAVREALFGTKRGFDRGAFKAKYGMHPTGFGESETNGLRLPMQLFLYSENSYFFSFLAVPDDLATLLREFVHPPEQAALRSVQDPPNTIKRHQSEHSFFNQEPKARTELIQRNMEHAAPHDLSSVLQLIDRGKITVSAKTLRPTAASTKQIANVLVEGDFYELVKKEDKYEQTIGPIKAFAWCMLLQTAKLAELRGSKLALTKKGSVALGATAAESLRELWQKWLANALIDEFSRVDDIKGQRRGRGRHALTAKNYRREVVALALAECPIGRWVHFGDFSKYMRAADFDFEITHDPWRLYIGDPEYGSLGYSDNHGWEILEARYVLCLLFEYFATLGMIDVAFTNPHYARPDFNHIHGSDELYYLSRYDGLEYFRLNSLGAYCLGLNSEYKPTTVSKRTGLSIYSDLRIQAKDGVPPDERLFLESFAEPETTGIWRLSLERSLESIENGHDIEKLRAFLSSRDEQTLPETVEGFLRKVARGAKALKKQEQALLIECTSVEIADTLSTHMRTSKYCQRVGEKHVVLRNSKAIEFRKAIHDLGYALPSTQ